MAVARAIADDPRVTEPPSKPMSILSTSERLAKYAELLNAHPSLSAYGVRLSFPDERRLRIEVSNVSPSMRGGMGDDAVVNGGVLSALCDLMIGSTAGLVEPGARSATVQLSIRFERPLRGQRIEGEARADHSTGRTIFASGELSDEEGRVCVRCQGLATLLRPSSSGG